MNVSLPVRHFRLSPLGVHCDDEGLTLGGIALLMRDPRGAWSPREARDLNPALSRVYGFPVDVAARRHGLNAVATALGQGEIARAQIATLLLQLPDPPCARSLDDDGPESARLATDLRACGLMKADPGWEDEHPRAGQPPNPGWFAPKPKTEAGDPPPPSIDEGSSPSAAFVPFAPAAGPAAWLGSDLSATVLEGLATLASRYSGPAILFGAIFVPGQNTIVDQGPVPGRADMSYRWARDEGQVTFNLLIDGQTRTFAVGTLKSGEIFVDGDGEIVARMVRGPAGKTSLVTTLEALDRAAANFRDRNKLPVVAPPRDDREPRLCPIPQREAITTKSENSIAYQQYVSGIPYGWAYFIGRVSFDANLNLFGWVNPKNDPKKQMRRQSDAALAGGRIVVWHAQTWKGYLALSKIASEGKFPNLFVVYDPNMTEKAHDFVVAQTVVGVARYPTGR